MKRLLLFTLVLTLQAHAESRKIKLRTLCLEHSGSIREVVALQPGQETPATTLKLFTSTFSDEVETTIENNRLSLALPPLDGKPSPPFATPTCPPGERQLAIFLPGPSEKNPYQVLILDDSEKSFPMGQTLAYNLSQGNVRFAIGENQLDLKPSKHGLIPRAKKLNAMNQASVVISFTNASGTLVPVNSTRWLSSDQQRTLALAFVHPRTRQPTVQAYVDTPPWRRPQLGE